MGKKLVVEYKTSKYIIFIIFVVVVVVVRGLAFLAI